MGKPPKAPLVDRELIHELTKLLDETGLTEIEIEQGGQRVRVARNVTVPRHRRRPSAWRRRRSRPRNRRARRRICPSIRAW